MSQPFKRTLFSALLVIPVPYPVLGPKLRTVGIKLEVPGVDVQTLWTIAAAVLAMFVQQLFRDRTPLKLGRGVDYKVNGSDPKSFLSLPSAQRWAVLALIVVAFVWPFFVSRGAVDTATLTLIYVMSSIGLDIAVGLIGLLDLGYVDFYAVGAYAYALLVEYAGFGFWTALPIAGTMTTLLGFLLSFPVLHLRGDYLTIVIFGLGETIRILLRNMTEITGGLNGIGPIPKPILFGLTFERHAPEGMQIFHEFFDIAYNINYKVILLYVVALLLVLLTLLMINRLMRMLISRAWEAPRGDEVVCRAPGLNPTTAKLSAFTIGASFAGFAGSFFAAHQGLVTPESFTFIGSAMILAIVVLGGMGSQFGVTLAAVMMVLPQEMCGFNEYRMLIFGLTMIVVMTWRPQGLLPMQCPHLKPKPRADRFSKRAA